jgi:hypothetical protein
MLFVAAIVAILGYVGNPLATWRWQLGSGLWFWLMLVAMGVVYSRFESVFQEKGKHIRRLHLLEVVILLVGILPAARYM